MQQLQNLVRENFDLLVRCAEGIDLFSEQTGRRKNDDNNTSSSGNDGPGLTERMDMLDSLSALCSNQAKSSFKPLLDNTREVRKVQSALSVLNRVGPLLKVPNEMRQHIENGRFSSAVKAYRSVRMIDDGGDGIQLLRSVKKRAAEAANDARRDLEVSGCWMFEYFLPLPLSLVLPLSLTLLLQLLFLLPLPFLFILVLILLLLFPL